MKLSLISSHWPGLGPMPSPGTKNEDNSSQITCMEKWERSFPREISVHPLKEGRMDARKTKITIVCYNT